MLMLAHMYIFLAVTWFNTNMIISNIWVKCEMIRLKLEHKGFRWILKIYQGKQWLNTKTGYCGRLWMTFMFFLCSFATFRYLVNVFRHKKWEMCGVVYGEWGWECHKLTKLLRKYLWMLHPQSPLTSKRVMSRFEIWWKTFCIRY